MNHSKRLDDFSIIAKRLQYKNRQKKNSIFYLKKLEENKMNHTFATA